MSTDVQEAIGDRLRATRRALGLSLADVQGKSRGRWHASVVGSYERGTRAVSAASLCELAAFYGVPPSVLLPEDDARPDARVSRLAEVLHVAGVGPGEYAHDLARRLVVAGVAAPRAKRS